jgi:hypothetical protein
VKVPNSPSALTNESTRVPSGRKEPTRLEADRAVTFVRGVESDYARAAIALEPRPKEGRRDVIGHNLAAVIYRIGFVWHGRGWDEDGWIDKTRHELKRECGLTSDMLRGVMALGERLGLLQKKRVRGRNGRSTINAWYVPDSAKVWAARVVAKHVLTMWADDRTKQAARLREKAGAYLHNNTSYAHREQEEAEVATLDTPRGGNFPTPHQSDGTFPKGGNFPTPHNYSTTTMEREAREMEMISGFLKGKDLPLTEGETRYNTDKLREVIETCSPTDQELRELPEWCWRYVVYHKKLDVFSAMRLMRTERQKEQLEAQRQEKRNGRAQEEGPRAGRSDRRKKLVIDYE